MLQNQGGLFLWFSVVPFLPLIYQKLNGVFINNLSDLGKGYRPTNDPKCGLQSTFQSTLSDFSSIPCGQISFKSNLSGKALMLLVFGWARPPPEETVKWLSDLESPPLLLTLAATCCCSLETGVIFLLPTGTDSVVDDVGGSCKFFSSSTMLLRCFSDSGWLPGNRYEE